ncbi:MAG: aspartate/glutamate racemase family protein [Sulfurospirillaceae bacterium]|nr:aspartate/glutamate racemase family protein [Sulfurospirillaceae bacterium]
MKTIGLLGGMSWESTHTYYKLLNEGTKELLGGFNSAKIILISVNFDEIETLQRENRWEEAGEILAENAKSLEEAGADFILICTNTMHKVADIIQKNINIPILHIATSVSMALQKENCRKAILLGTRFTMQENFIKDVIRSFGIEVVTPDTKQIEIIDKIIFDELVQGIVNQESKNTYLNIILDMIDKDEQIDSVILGCTEIGLLINQNDINLKIFDTTYTHVKYALDITHNNHSL